MNAGQAGDPLGVEGVGLVRRLVELGRVVETAGVHGQFSEQVHDALFRRLRIKRGRDLERRGLVTDRLEKPGLHIAGQRLVRLQLQGLVGEGAGVLVVLPAKSS